MKQINKKKTHTHNLGMFWWYTKCRIQNASSVMGVYEYSQTIVIIGSYKIYFASNFAELSKNYANEIELYKYKSSTCCENYYHAMKKILLFWQFSLVMKSKS